MSTDLPIDLIPIEFVRIDGGTQARAAIDENVIAEYAAAMVDAQLPPLVVFFDGVDFWLADGFHRYHAHKANDAWQVPCNVHNGTRRDAVLYSVGANGSHGLRRSNEDKRKAVATLLADPEWAAWSDREIARQCGVSDRFVNGLRASANDSQMHPVPATRTVTRNGKTYEQKTEKIGKSPKAKAAAPAPQAADPVLEVATPRVTPEHGAVASASLEDLLAENAALREQLAECQAKLAEVMEHRDDIADALADTLADNEMMTRVFESDDQVKASMMEVARFKALAENAERTLDARSHEFNERARNVAYWKRRAEKAEKQLGLEAGDAA